MLRVVVITIREDEGDREHLDALRQILLRLRSDCSEGSDGRIEERGVPVQVVILLGHLLPARKRPEVEVDPVVGLARNDEGREGLNRIRRLGTSQGLPDVVVTFPDDIGVGEPLRVLARVRVDVLERSGVVDEEGHQGDPIRTDWIHGGESSADLLAQRVEQTGRVRREIACRFRIGKQL